MIASLLVIAGVALWGLARRRSVRAGVAATVAAAILTVGLVGLNTVTADQASAASCSEPTTQTRGFDPAKKAPTTQPTPEPAVPGVVETPRQIEEPGASTTPGRTPSPGVGTPEPEEPEPEIEEPPTPQPPPDPTPPPTGPEVVPPPTDPVWPPIDFEWP